MITYVIDASVAVKWLIQEPFRQEAKRFLNISLDRLSPDLILLECANAMRRKVLLKQITQQEGDTSFELIKEWKQGLMRLIPTPDFLERAYELSKALQQHPIPDCIYLALAEQENVQMVTADRRFYDLVLKSTYHDLIAWIEDQPEEFT